MLGFEKVLNELTLILTLGTMACVFLYKKGIIPIGLLIFMCILTILVYLSNRTLINTNSKLDEKEKENLVKIEKEVKKGKKQ